MMPDAPQSSNVEPDPVGPLSNDVGESREQPSVSESAKKNIAGGSPDPSSARQASKKRTAKPGSQQPSPRGDAKKGKVSRKTPPKKAVDAVEETAASLGKKGRAKPPKPAQTRRKAKDKIRLPFVSTEVVDEEEPTRWERIRAALPKWRANTSFVVSIVVHALLFIILALIAIVPKDKQGLLTIDSGFDDTSQITKQLQAETRLQSQTMESKSTFQISTEVELPLPKAESVGVQATRAQQSPSPLATANDLQAFANLPTGGGMSGRSEEKRNELVVSEGGNEASERAVELGLAWLAAHQRENGAWWFNFHDSECRGRCRHPGSVGTSTGATGLALLCFLGRGETPDQGKYKEEVRRGLYYLQNRMVFTKYGGDLQEGSMYGHAIATTALCEAYGMTGDQSLRPIAQKAIDFIVHAQHDKGGWRYTPGSPGDTTVTGWQVMALRSAHLAGLEVPTPTTEMVKLYLDSVQTHLGARYKYLPEYEEETPVPTAVGLLCRMYLGWSRVMTPLREGAKYLAELGPSATDLYFDYYATQVLHHFGEPYWDGWNRLMRDYLVGSQAQSGHEKGSWHFDDEHGNQGGRLYSTAMAVMILEVYYRYLPLYEEKAVDFPL